MSAGGLGRGLPSRIHSRASGKPPAMRTRVSRTILTASASFIRPSAAALPVIPLLLAQKTAARRSLIRTGEAETERKKQNIEMFGDSIRTSPVYAHQRRGPVRLMCGSGIFFFKRRSLYNCSGAEKKTGLFLTLLLRSQLLLLVWSQLQQPEPWEWRRGKRARPAQTAASC